MKKAVAKLLTVSLVMASPLALSCSQAQETDRFAEVEIKADKIADGIAVLFGAGGNIGVSYGPDGTVLIDDQFAPLTPKIEAAIAELGAEPVKYLINTHWHADHTGGNENFGKAGALIMAHDNVRVRMGQERKSGESTIPPSPKEALPVVTFSNEMSLHLNGDEIHAHHFANGHTDGDSAIFWRKANVIHMGDLYFNEVSLPYIALGNGGNVRGVLAAAEHVLEKIDDNTKIIPGHGPMATKADLTKYRDMLKSVIGAVEQARADDKTLEQIQAMKPAEKWDTNPDGFISGDAFVEAVYRSLDVPKEQDASKHKDGHKH